MSIVSRLAAAPTSYAFPEVVPQPPSYVSSDATVFPGAPLPDGAIPLDGGAVPFTSGCPSASAVPLSGEAVPLVSGAVPLADGSETHALLLRLLSVLLRVIGPRRSLTEHKLLRLLAKRLRPDGGHWDDRRRFAAVLDLIRALGRRHRDRIGGTRHARWLISKLARLIFRRRSRASGCAASDGDCDMSDGNCASCGGSEESDSGEDDDLDYEASYGSVDDDDSADSGDGDDDSYDSDASDVSDSGDDGGDGNVGRGVLRDDLTCWRSHGENRSRFFRRPTHLDDDDHDYYHARFRSRWGHAHEEEEHYFNGSSDDEPGPLAIKDAARLGLNREVATVHGDHDHTYPHHEDLYDGFLNHPHLLNGFMEGPTGRDYDCRQGGRGAHRYFLNHFLVTIENKRGHPYECKIGADGDCQRQVSQRSQRNRGNSGDCDHRDEDGTPEVDDTCDSDASSDDNGYCLEVNGVKGRILFLERGRRYVFTFKIIDRDDVRGEEIDVNRAKRERFMLTCDNTGGPRAVKFPWAPDPIPVGSSCWVDVPACAPPVGFYQLTRTTNCGFMIVFYGGEYFRHY